MKQIKRFVCPNCGCEIDTKLSFDIMNGCKYGCKYDGVDLIERPLHEHKIQVTENLVSINYYGAGEFKG